MNERNLVMRKYYLMLAGIIFLLDQVAKRIVIRRIPLNESIPVLDGFFRLSHVRNPGAAFGLFAESHSSLRIVFLVLFSLFAMGVVGWLLWKSSHVLSTTGVALALILGGAFGNLYDRLVDGYVVDFLAFYFGSYHWPDFNVADSAIVIGAILLVAEILFAKSPAEEQVQS